MWEAFCQGEIAGVLLVRGHMERLSAWRNAGWVVGISRDVIPCARAGYTGISTNWEGDDSVWWGRWPECFGGMM